MQARYYDPMIGRFLGEDPVTFLETGDTAQFNRYAYANNDPVNMFDPNGRDGLFVNNQVTNTQEIIIPVNFTGSGATKQRVAAMVSRTESLNTPSGVNIDVQPVIGLDAETAKQFGFNTLNIGSGPDTALCGEAGSCVNKIGGDIGHVDGSRADAIGVAAHEIPHFVGIDEQYDEGRDSSGNRTSIIRTDMEKNIMATTDGTEINSSQVIEARDNPSTINCTISSKGNSC